MGIVPTRAFTDLHHLTTQTVYAGEDFSLIKNDGSDNAIIHNDLDINTYPSWNINPETHEVFFPGYQTRSVVSAGDGTVSRKLQRTSYILMGRDETSKAIDPTYFLRDPTPNGATPGPKQQFDANGFDQFVVEFKVNDSMNEFIFGGMFVDNQGFPINVSINGVNYIGFGQFESGAAKRGDTIPQLLSPISYPANPSNTRSIPNSNMGVSISGSGGTGNRYRYIYDKDSSAVAAIEKQTGNITAGPSAVNNAITSAIFSNSIVPMLYGINTNDFNNTVTFEWSVFYRNKSDV